MEKRSIHFNFALLLAIFFAFFALAFIGVERFQGRDENLNGQFNTADEDKLLAEKFGAISDGEPEIINDPVLGTQTKWANGDISLILNSQQVIYRDSSVTLAKITDSKELQDRAQEFLNNKELNGEVVLDHEKNKFLISDGEFEVVEDPSQADVLEVMFSDINTGDDKIRVRVSGSGEIIEVLIIRS